MGKQRRGRTVRRNRAKMKTNSDEEYKSAPHTMIFSRGRVGEYVRHLTQDMRSMFEPFTASNLEAKRRNKLKDFISIAGHLKVSHLMYFTRPQSSSDEPSSVYMHLVKMPQGPTLTFRVLEYALRKNVQSYVRRMASPTIFQHPPLQVLHGFSGDGLHLKLMVSMIQNLLPPINVRTIRLKTVRRVLLWSRVCPETKEEPKDDDNDVGIDESELQEGDVVHLRQYSLHVRTRGLSRPMKRLQRKQVPNLGDYSDMHEWVTRGGLLSDSGVSEESCTENEVEVPSTAGLQNRVTPGAKASVHTRELGPRLTLQLIKVEVGVCDGEVLYHRFQQKTPSEVRELQQRARSKRKAKIARREAQAAAVEKKRQKKEEHKRKCLDGMGIKTDPQTDKTEEENEEVSDVEGRDEESDSDNMDVDE